MPAPAKTSDDAIVDAAREIVERDGSTFSMASVADAVGVKTPSLYKRFADRETLLARVRRDAYDALREAIVKSARRREGGARVHAMANAYRTFARKHPQLYALLFLPEEAFDAATHDARVASAAPVLETLREIAGPENALNAARAFTAFLHGHVTMASAGAFRLGGNVDEAFEYGIDRLLAGIAAK